MTVKGIKSFASGNEVVLWCEKCRGIVARLGGIHDVEYIVTLANEHHNCNGVKTNAETQAGG